MHNGRMFKAKQEAPVNPSFTKYVKIVSSGKHVRVIYTLLHPTLIYSKTGVYRGTHFFFCPKT